MLIFTNKLPSSRFPAIQPDVKLSRLWKKKKPSPYGLFPWNGTWAEAKSATTGYEAESITEAVVGRHREFLRDLNPSDFKVDYRLEQPLHHLMSSLAVIFRDHQPNPFRVLDFGGASATNFYLLRRVFPHVRFDWLVVETPPMCAALQSFTEEHLRWQTELPEPASSADKSFDLCIASSCLMYMDEPYDLLPKLARLGRYFFVNRIPILPIPEDRIAIQHVPPIVHETSHPFWLFSEGKMLRDISKIGKMRFSWDDPLSEKKLGEEPVRFKGYLIENA
jgi:putative methyltransferase (TIGR04325 family)